MHASDEILTEISKTETDIDVSLGHPLSADYRFATLGPGLRVLPDIRADV